MTLDDAAAILDVTEEHVKDLIRDGDLPGYRYRKSDGCKILYIHGLTFRTRGYGTKAQRGQWFVSGARVRARRRRLAGQ